MLLIFLLGSLAGRARGLSRLGRARVWGWAGRTEVVHGFPPPGASFVPLPQLRVAASQALGLSASALAVSGTRG